MQSLQFTQFNRTLPSEITPKIYELRGHPRSLRKIRISRISKYRAFAASQIQSSTNPDSPIILTSNALTHLKRLKESRKTDKALLLRIGIKSGGCSGMSYHMDFESCENISEDDMVLEYGEGDFKMVCDPKSLLYLFGMRLDYSDALIGGGFQFHNPNATDQCGCGKSFGV